MRISDWSSDVCSSDLSLSWFDRALDDPFYKTRAMAYGNAGRCAVEAGLMERAEGYFRKALEIDPNFADVLEDMASLSLRRGDFLRARAFIQRREARSEERRVGTEGGSTCRTRGSRANYKK